MNLKWNDTMKLFKYGYIFLVCLLSGCATHQKVPESTIKQPTTTVETLTNKPKQPASTVSSWELSGAMAARNQKKGWNASLHWAQQGINRYQIHLNGPLGGGSVIIKKEDGLVTYTDGTKKASSSNADELLLKQTGIQLPVNNLYYWVRGLAAPGAVTTSKFDEQHRLISLTQAGYTIHYTHYLSVNQIELPGKIELQGHGVVIKLVIKHCSV